MNLPQPFAGLKPVDPPPGLFTCVRCRRLLPGEELEIGRDQRYPVCIDQVECSLALILAVDEDDPDERLRLMNERLREAWEEQERRRRIDAGPEWDE